MDISKVNGELVFTHSNGTSITVNNQFLDSHEMYSIVNRFVKADFRVGQSDEIQKKENRIFLPLFYHTSAYQDDSKTLTVVDKLFSFVDMLEDKWDVLDFIVRVSVRDSSFNPIPKGYPEFCKRKGMRIYGHSRDCFTFYKMTESLPLKYRSILREVFDGSLCKEWVNIYSNTDELISFAKAFINSTKKVKEVVRLEGIMYELSKKDGDRLDGTKTLQENLDIFKAENKKRESQAIRESQLKYSELEKINSHGLRVVVPLSIEELEDEGNQQSNCVGNFYNDNICDGDCIIYFIREEDKLEKSYITCRYNFDEEETEEALARFNNNYEDERVDEIIEWVDETMKNWE